MNSNIGINTYLLFNSAIISNRISEARTAEGVGKAIFIQNGQRNKILNNIIGQCDYGIYQEVAPGVNAVAGNIFSECSVEIFP